MLPGEYYERRVRIKPCIMAQKVYEVGDRVQTAPWITENPHYIMARGAGTVVKTRWGRRGAYSEDQWFATVLWDWSGPGGGRYGKTMVGTHRQSEFAQKNLVPEEEDVRLEPKFRPSMPEAPFGAGHLVSERGESRDSWHGDIGIVEWCEPSRIGVGPITWVCSVFWPEVAQRMHESGQRGTIGHSPRSRYLAENLVLAIEPEEFMEPNPTHIDLRRRDAPLHPGDVVRYCGPAIGASGGYFEARQRGIVQWVRQQGDYPYYRWWAGVRWDDTGRSRWGAAASSRYLAINLCLLQKNVPHAGWNWPPNDKAMRAEDV